MSAETLSEALARRLESVVFETLSPAVRQSAILHTLDTVGVLLAGSRLEPGRRAYALARSLGGSPEVTLPGTPDQVPLLAGIMAAATAAHCGEMDDIHGGAGTCVGGMILPALLALTEKFGAGGRSFLEAVVAGYETTVRVGLAINAPRLFARGWWPSSLCGVFGVAAAGAKLLGWTAERAAAALGIAGIQTGGLLTGGGEGATARHLVFGRAAQIGVLSLLAVREGFTGPKRIFEDPRGFCLTLCEDPRWEYLRAPADGQFLTETAFKPYPCARQLHASVEALLQVMVEEKLAPGSLEEIEVGVPTSVAAMVDRPRIDGNRAVSLASAQYVLAAAAFQGKLNLGSFEPEVLTDPDVARLMGKVRVQADPGLDPHFPKYWPGRVRVKLRGGGESTRRILAPKGEKENPMPPAEVEGKFRELTAPVLGAERAAALAREVHRLADGGPMSPLFSALASPSTRVGRSEPAAG